MDALMAALVAALLCHASDRTAWLAAMLGSRYRAAWVIGGAGLAIVLGNTLAALGGTLLAPQMSPNARDLLLALALLSAGIGAFWPIKPPRLPARFGLGAFGTACVGTLALSLGDKLLFVTAALAARADTPALAAVGAVIGSLAIVVPATLLGERGRRRLPVMAIRIGAGIVLTVIAAIQGFAALRLI